MGAGSFLGVKWPKRGADHPTHLVPRLKEEYSYTYTPLWAFLDCFRAKFTFVKKGKAMFQKCKEGSFFTFIKPTA